MIVRNKRKLYFFDFSTCADLWKQTYTSMINTLHAAELVPNAMVTNKIVNLIGGSPPPLLLLSIEQIQEKLTDQTLDIGMCGFVIDYDNIDIRKHDILGRLLQNTNLPYVNYKNKSGLQEIEIIQFFLKMQFRCLGKR